MGFDTKEFMKAKFMHRTEKIPVPDLAAFFAEGEEAAWTVRGLTGQEVGRANEAPERMKLMVSMVEGLMSPIGKEQVDTIKSLLGMDGPTPEDTARRIAYLMIGSVNPVCTQDLAVKLCETFTGTFITLTQRIKELTAMGKLPGKQPPSGETQTSGTASPSVTPGGGSSTKRGRTSSRKGS